MRNWTAFAIGVGILVAAAYGAPKSPRQPPADDEKQQRIEQAKRDLANAEGRLRSADRRADRAERDLENAIRDRERVGQELSRANQEEGDLARIIGSHEREARDQQEVRNKVKAHSDAAGKAAGDAKRATAEAGKAVEEARKTAEKDYLASAESRDRVAKVDAITASLAAERERVVGELSKQSSYQQMKREAEIAEAAVQSARDNPHVDPATLARSSQAWIDAKSRVESAEREACKADPAYVHAEASLAQAKADHQQQINAFRQQLPTHPAVAPAISLFAEAQRAQEQSAQQHVRALADLKQAESAFQQAAGRYNETNARLTQARVIRDRLAAQLVAADRNVSAQERDLADAKGDLRDARRDVEDARRRLREAERA